MFVTLSALAEIIPSPSPGYNSALLAWPIKYSVPLYLTGFDGLPVTTRALSSLQFMMSSAFASHNYVGFEIGIIAGLAQISAIFFTTSSVKAPLCPEVPISTSGFTSFIMSLRSVSLLLNSCALLA